MGRLDPNNNLPRWERDADHVGNASGPNDEVLFAPLSRAKLRRVRRALLDESDRGSDDAVDGRNKFCDSSSDGSSDGTAVVKALDTGTSRIAGTSALVPWRAPSGMGRLDPNNGLSRQGHVKIFPNVKVDFARRPWVGGTFVRGRDSGTYPHPRARPPRRTPTDPDGRSVSPPGVACLGSLLASPDGSAIATDSRGREGRGVDPDADDIVVVARHGGARRGDVVYRGDLGWRPLERPRSEVRLSAPVSDVEWGEDGVLLCDVGDGVERRANTQALDVREKKSGGGNAAGEEPEGIRWTDIPTNGLLPPNNDCPRIETNDQNMERLRLSENVGGCKESSQGTTESTALIIFQGEAHDDGEDFILV